ncbi:MAG: InlB B-repeat-containing protein [Treponema sp.]|jgi:uncharacterized repeat protein (TIGR02543 family)|nr:InlB B-repeat-containing protein [Treponema sp.]
MNKSYFFRRLSRGLLAALALACIFTGCPTNTEDTGANEPTTYTVTFNTNGGSLVNAVQVQEGQKLTKPEDPTKPGNTFSAWYKDAAYTILWNFDQDVVVQDLTLSAEWIEGENVTPHTVTFDADGGTPEPQDQSVFTGKKVAEPKKPAKTGYIFEGWYNGNQQWNFSTNTVSAALTLKATWAEAVTVTFNTDGGSAIEPLTLKKNANPYLENYRPTKKDHVFDGWYTDEALTTPASTSLTVSSDITLYAKWTSTDALADYVGVWRSGNSSYILENDGTCWWFSAYEWYKRTWSLTEIDGYGVTFSENKTTFTLKESTYTKNTTDTKTPAKAAGLIGSWVGGSSKIEFKDAAAVITRSGGTLALGYCVDGTTLYLLQANTNRVICSIPLEGGKPEGFDKVQEDPYLAGIWKLTHKDQDYYWNLQADGTGTFHTLGASVPVSLTVTATAIDGTDYTISDDTLTVPGWDDDERIDINYTKVASIPAGSGAGGDNRLVGTWKGVSYGYTISITFKADGTAEQQQSSGTLSYSSSAIWKADGTNMSLYDPSFGTLPSGQSGTYEISGSTLDVGGTVLTKQ